MKILDSIQEQPKPFQPVYLLLETQDELKLIKKLLGKTSNNEAMCLLESKEVYDVYPMYLQVSNKCTEFGI